MNIYLMSRADLEIAIIEDNDLYNYFHAKTMGKDVSKLSDDEIREIITEWIIEGDETYKF